MFRGGKTNNCTPPPIPPRRRFVTKPSPRVGCCTLLSRSLLELSHSRMDLPRNWKRTNERNGRPEVQLTHDYTAVGFASFWWFDVACGTRSRISVFMSISTVFNWKQLHNDKNMSKNKSVHTGIEQPNRIRQTAPLLTGLTGHPEVFRWFNAIAKCVAIRVGSLVTVQLT